MVAPGEELLNKLGYKQFALELTRRCNMSCIHCSRGDAQNIDMSKEILFKSLNNLQTIEEYLDNDRCTFALYFYGGEPFLCPDIIHDCIEYIIEKNIFLLSMWVITNGTVLSDDIAKDFEKVKSHIENCRKIFENKNRDEYKKLFDLLDKEEVMFFDENPVSIQISFNYHNKEQSEKALEFYKRYNIHVKYFDKKDPDNNKSIQLSYSGRAKELINDKSIFFIIKDNHCMATGLKENNVEKTICIGANGNVFLGLDYEYNNVDSDNMGNILQENIYDMAIKWNYKYPILYREMRNMLKYKSGIFNYENNFKSSNDKSITKREYKHFKDIVTIYEKNIELRKKIHKQFDCLPIDQILYQGDIVMELESDGRYIELFYDEKDKKGWDFKKEKENLIKNINSLPIYNEELFYDKPENKHLKPIHEKYPCLDRRDCIELENAIKQFYAFNKDKSIKSQEILNRQIDVIRKLKLKYWRYDMTMDEEIEKGIMKNNTESVDILKRLLKESFNIFKENILNRMEQYK